MRTTERFWPKAVVNTRAREAPLLIKHLNCNPRHIAGTLKTRRCTGDRHPAPGPSTKITLIYSRIPTTTTQMTTIPKLTCAAATGLHAFRSCCSRTAAAIASTLGESAVQSISCPVLRARSHKRRDPAPTANAETCWPACAATNDRRARSVEHN